MNFTTKFPEFKPWLSFKCAYEIDGCIVVDSLLWLEDHGERFLYKNDWSVHSIPELESHMKELNAVYIIAEKDSK
ncbi:MAG: hypothetical protein EOM41_01320 [Bacilli bacterium]|nr:hypothetical protein [Bacilli bacterium]